MVAREETVRVDITYEELLAWIEEKTGKKFLNLQSVSDLDDYSDSFCLTLNFEE